MSSAIRANGLMSPKSQAPPPPKYIDRPEISEVFADRLEHLFFDDGVLRMEFTVTRTDPAYPAPAKPTAEPKRWSYTACRVALSMGGIVEMLNAMQKLKGELLRQGLLQERPSAPASEPTASQRSAASPP